MKRIALFLCLLLSSSAALSADMGNFGLNFISVNFAAPVVYDRTTINAPEAGTIVYDSLTSGFYGLPPGANPTNGWMQLSGPTLFASTQVTTQSTAITSSSFTTFSNSPGLTFKPTVTGTYKVYSSVPTQTSNASSEAVIRISNTSGSGTLLYESQAVNFVGTASGLITSLYTESVYALTAGTTYTFDIQGKDVASVGVDTRGDVSPFYVFAQLAQ